MWGTLSEKERKKIAPLLVGLLQVDNFNSLVGIIDRTPLWTRLDGGWLVWSAKGDDRLLRRSRCSYPRLPILRAKLLV